LSVGTVRILQQVRLSKKSEQDVPMNEQKKQFLSHFVVYTCTPLFHNSHINSDSAVASEQLDKVTI